MIRLIERILEDVKRGENIDLVTAIILVAVTAVLNSLGLTSQAIVSSVTLATLGLVATGFLITRYRIESIYSREATGNTVQLLFEKPATLENMLANTEEIWLVGLTLRGTTTENFYVLKTGASRGMKIRTMIIDQDAVDMTKVVRRFSRAATVENFRADFAQTKNQYQCICESSSNRNNVQLRLLDFVPSFSLYIFPKTDHGGVILVETYCYKSRVGSVPRYQVTEHDNLEWYRYFMDQFEMMWQDAKTVTLQGKNDNEE